MGWSISHSLFTYLLYILTLWIRNHVVILIVNVQHHAYSFICRRYITFQSNLEESSQPLTIQLMCLIGFSGYKMNTPKPSVGQWAGKTPSHGPAPVYECTGRIQASKYLCYSQWKPINFCQLWLNKADGAHLSWFICSSQSHLQLLNSFKTWKKLLVSLFSIQDYKWTLPYLPFDRGYLKVPNLVLMTAEYRAQTW